MAEVPIEGVSPETLREIHQDEIRLHRSQMLSSASLGALAGLAWAVAEVSSPGGPMSFPLGLLAVERLMRTAQHVGRWWTVRQRDPVATAAEPVAVRDRALASAAAQAARFASHPAYATYTIAAALVLTAMLEFLAVGSVPRSVTVAGLDKARVAAGEWWRLLTAAFLHGSGLHLWANVSALAVFGRIVEAYSTRSRLLVVYLTAVVAGNLASTTLLPHAASIGASGGILGLVGFVYALSRRRPSEVPASYGRAAMSTMILTGLIGAVGFRFIDNAAHAGGALAGFLIGWLTVPQEPSPAERSVSRYEDDSAVSMSGALAAVVLAATAVFTATKVLAERPRPVTSLRVNIIAADDRRFNVRLENLSDTPVEAYTLDVYDSGFPVYQQWRDERGFEDSSRGGAGGSIAPREQRTVPLGDSRRPLVHPSVRIVAAVFGDGRFEGSAAEYDHIAERRAEVRADANYWIVVIDEALMKPPDQVASFLDAKIGDRAKANGAAHRASYLGSVGWLLGSATHTPDRFAGDAQAERARLVKLRDALSSSVR